MPFAPLDIASTATATSAKGMFNGGGGEIMTLDDWSTKIVEGVPFQLVDPDEGRVKNVIVLNGPLGNVSRKMPKAVTVECNGKARAIHLLSGVSGWGFPYGRDKTVSLIVRLRYANGETEEHKLKNAIHFADYIRHIDVPESKAVFRFQGGQQMRYLALHPEKSEEIDEIEFVKGPDDTAPVIMAVTIEKP